MNRCTGIRRCILGQARVPVLLHHRTRTRYFSTEVPFFSTGTRNCAANAAVFVNLYVELIISQSPPIGSFASTEMGASLWLRSVISYSNSYSRSESFL